MHIRGTIVSILGAAFICAIFSAAWVMLRARESPHDPGSAGTVADSIHTTKPESGQSHRTPGHSRRAPPPIVAAATPGGNDKTPTDASTMNPADRYAGDPVLSRAESITADGTILRVRVVKTDFKYPLLRVEDVIIKDPRTGNEILSKQTAMVADHVLVKPRPGIAPAEFQAMIARHGGILRRKIPNSDIHVIRFPKPGLDTVPDAVAAMTAEVAIVKYAEPDYIVHAQVLPDDSRFAELWGMHNIGQTGGTVDADIDAPEAWDISTGNPSLRVAVIDTGIDRNHPDLAANMWSNPGEIANNGIDDDSNGYVDDFHGWDFLNEDNDPADDHGHGTHCAGTIGSVGNDGQGVTGVCWRVSLVALKFLGANGSGVSSDAAEAVHYATGIGVVVTSNSWGGSGNSQTLKDAIDAADAAGILFIAAAGNANTNNDALPFYPSAYSSPNIISVAATDHYDNRASFSNYGANTVDLAAPGVAILSCSPGTGYATLSGTSMATPHVAGACALLWSHRPSLSHHELKDLLLGAADVIPAITDQTLTNGRLNIGNALRSDLSVTPYGTLASTGYQAGGFTPTSHSITLTNLGSNPLQWTAANTQPWLELSSTGGTLDPNASATLSLSLNTGAGGLGSGAHADLVTFTDTDTGVTLTRRFNLTVLPPLTVTPTNQFLSRGEAGGPFTPPMIGYILTNESMSPLDWSATTSDSWLDVSSDVGSLPPGRNTQLVLRLNEASMKLQQGYHIISVWINNLTNGESVPIYATLIVGPDPLTELFDTSLNDTAYQEFTFTPDSTASSYRVTRRPATGFPTNPNGGIPLQLGDDQSIAVSLAGGANIPFFGTTHTTFYVSSNGYITFGAGDTDVTESLNDHFRLPRISALFDDLDPSAGGSVTWKQLADRAVITCQNVPQWYIGGSNSFQTEIFFDGRIRITLLEVSSGDGLIGLSRGTGIPSPFYESDFTAYPPTPLVVSTLVDEDDGGVGLGAGDSLREMIAAAELSPGPDVIHFKPSLDAGTVILTGTPLTVNSDLTVETTGLCSGIAVSGGQTSRVFQTQAGTLVSLSGMNITGGWAYDGAGGGILNEGALYLSNVTVADNQSLDFYAAGSGGGIYNTGILRLDRSTVSQNHVFFGNGGGVSNRATLELVNSTISENSVQVGFGAGVFNYSGTVKLNHTTISANCVASGLGGGISSPTGILSSQNSIIAGNRGDAGIPDEIHCPSILLLAANFTSGNPMIAPLANYGGNTKSMPPLPGSPVIDAAIPLAETSSTDQLGVARPCGPLPDLGSTEAFPFSILPLVDEDGDQIDDRLEPAYHLTVGIDDSGVDSDGDGSCDAEEIANMTDPLDPNSRLKIISFTPAPGFTPEFPEFIVTFTSFPGLSYTLECDQNLDFNSSRVLVLTPTPATDFMTSVHVGVAPGHDFVRIRREP